jgi:hypothetical protein
MSGLTTQYLSATNPIEVTHFYCNYSDGIVKLASNIKFINTRLHLDYEDLDIQSYQLEMVGQYSTGYNSIYSSGGSLRLSDEAYWANDIYGDISFYGIVEVHSFDIYGNLTVEDTLRTDDYSSYNINLEGNLINNGLISNNGSNFGLYIAKDFTNNGTISNHLIRLDGDTIQNVAMTQPIAPSYFEAINATGYINALSDFEIISSTIDFNNEDLFMNSFTLDLNDCKMNEFELYADGGTMHMSNGSYTSYVNFRDDITFTGTVLIGTYTDSYGTVTVQDTVMNYPYSYYTWEAWGSVINNGYISDNTNYTLDIDVFKNITNNGVWMNDDLELDGDSIQQLLASQPFSTNYFNVSNSDGFINAVSDVSFINTTVDFNWEELYLNGHKLSVSGEEIKDLNLYADSGVVKLSDNAIIHNSNIYEDVSLEGRVQVASNIYFYDNMTVTDTMTNYWASNYNMDCLGNITNNGWIINNPDGHQLYIDAFANIENNGVWTNYDIEFFDNPHVISATQPIGVDVFESIDTLGYFSLVNDVTFENTELEFDYNEVYLNGHTLSVTGSTSTWIDDGVFYANGGSLFMSGGCDVTNSSFQDSINLHGRIQLHSVNNEFLGPVVVFDTLENNEPDNYSADFYGTVYNNGIIRNNSDGHDFDMYIYSHLINNGIIENDDMYFNGSGIQNIFSPGVFSPYSLYSNDTTGAINFLSDIVFDDVRADLNSEDVWLNGYTATLVNKWWQEVILHSNGGTVHCSEGAFIKEIDILDSISFAGRVRIHNDVYCYGALTLLDTLENSNSYFGLDVYGDFYNYGVVQDGPSYNFKLELYSDVFSQGNWTCSYTSLSGDYNQEVLFESGAVITDQVDIYANQPGASSYEWYKDGVSLVGETAGNFSNETSHYLKTENVVDTSYHGVYQCLTNAGNSRTITLGAWTVPVAVYAGMDEEICQGEPVTLIATATDGIPPYTYSWSSGETTQSIIVSPASTTTYTVTVEGNGGTIDSDEVLVTVNPVPVFDLGLTQEICAGETAYIEVTIPGIYTWNTNENTSYIEPGTAGTYSVTVTNSFGCIANDQVNVVVNPLPVFDIGANQEICAGETAYFEVLLPGSYNWSNGATSAVIEPGAAGLYSVTVTDQNGCMGTNESSVIVNPLPTVNLGPDLNLPAGSTPTLDAGVGFANYAWSTGAATQTIVVSVSGTYSVTVTDGNGCSNSDVINVTIDVPVNTLSVDLGSDQLLCDGEPVQITANATNGTTPYSFLWNTGATTQSITEYISTTSTFTVTVTDDNAFTASDNVTITLLPLPIVNLGPDLNLPSGSTPTLNAGAGLFFYTWSTGETTQTITVSTSGNYSVSVTDFYTCMNSDDINVTIAPPTTGGVYWVATNGSNVTGTGTETNPFATIQHAVDQCVAYDTVIVKDGTYTGAGNLNIEIDSLDIVVRSQNGQDNCILDGGSNSSYWAGFSILGPTSLDCMISGFTIKNVSGTGIMVNVADPHIEHCIIENCNTGIAAYGDWSGGTSSPMIYRCLIINNSGNGCTFFDGGSPHVVNSTIVGNSYGAEIAAMYATMTNNIIVGNDYGIFVSTYLPSGVTNTYNDVWSNTTNFANCSIGTGGISLNPQFVSANDFHLQVTSPCINAGDPALTDPDGSIADMGCYPYVGTVTTPLSVDLGVDQEICIGGQASFTPSVTGGTSPYNYAWNNGFTYANQTVYPIVTTIYTLTVTDNQNQQMIEDITVFVNSLPIPDLGPGKYGCEGDTYTLDAGPYSAYEWSTGATTQTITVDSTAFYWVNVTDSNGCVGTDIILVSLYMNPIVNLGADIESCEGNFETLQTPLAGNYQWNTGGTQSQIFVNTSGTYSLTVTDSHNCSGIDSVDVTFNQLPVIDLGADINSCEGSIETLQAPAAQSYYWSTGSTNSYIPVTLSGTYSVTIADANGCMASDQINVTFNPLPQVNLGADQIINEGSNFTFDAGAGFTSYLWSNSATTQTVTVGTQGLYEVTVTDNNGCSNSDEVYLNVLVAGSAPAWSPAITGVMHTILILDTTDITIDGVPISQGDYIGVFYDSLGTLACGGYVEWQQQTTSITAWGDDTYTNEKDGFDTGEAFNFVIWQASTGTSFAATPGYMPQPIMPNQGNYAVNGLSGLYSLHATTADYQYINLVQGWRFISTYIDLFEPSLDSLFAPIVSEVIIVKNGIGLTYWPQYNINVIGNMVLGQGYQLKMASAQTLVCEGVAVQPELTPINIPTGWSIIGYLRQSPANIASIFSTVVNDVIIVKNSLGLTYWPLYNLNTIGNMNPGEGYQIKMASSIQFTYPANSIPMKTCQAERPLCKYFNDIVQTGSSMTLGIPLEAWSQIPSYGDEIGIFNGQNQLVGASVFDGGFTAISIWGIDELDPSVSGLKEGEMYTAKIWRSNEKLEQQIELESFSEGNDSYASNNIAVLSKLAISGQSSDEISTIKVYPNPANSYAQISILAHQNTIADMALYNSTGEQVLLQKDINIREGEQFFKFDLSEFPSGLYILKIQTSKMVFNHSVELIK